MKHLPTNIIPYFELMRLDKRTGTYLTLLPCLWSIAISAQGTFPFFIYIIFILGAIIMRSAGCIINDIVDRKIDAGVERTKNRPLASGRIKLRNAVILLVFLLAIGAGLLACLNSTAKLLGLLILVPIFIYPFMKRVTYWPQAFLGMTINWGALMGGAAITDSISTESIIIYAACFFWTLGYDTIYAHQDKESDILIGVKSTAVKLGHYTKKYLYAFYGIMLALLWVAGVIADLSFIYHVTLLIAAIQTFWQVYEVNLDRPEDCLQKFRSNIFLGVLILAGMVIGGW